MGWGRIEDSIAHHPKLIAAGPVASWLWVCGIAYCNKYLTDGFISDLALTSVCPITNVKKWADRLTTVGLWERIDGGFQVHDFLEYNAPADRVRATRQEISEKRRRAGAVGGKQSGLVRRSKPEANNGSTSEANNRSKIEAPSHPIPVQQSKEHSAWAEKAPPDPRVKVFLEWFQEEYKAKRHGAVYLVDWGKDASIVKILLKVADLERLKNCAKILLSDKTDDPFIVDTDRGIRILRVKFNWLSDRLAAWEATRAKQA